MAEIGGMHAHKVTEIEGLNEGLSNMLKLLNELTDKVVNFETKLNELTEEEEPESD